MDINSNLYRSKTVSYAYGILMTLKNNVFKGGKVSMTEKEEKELNERLDRIEKQHEILRKAEGKEQYKDTSKGDRVIVYTNDKQAMKFWEE